MRPVPLLWMNQHGTFSPFFTSFLKSLCQPLLTERDVSFRRFTLRVHKHSNNTFKIHFACKHFQTEVFSVPGYIELLSFHIHGGIWFLWDFSWMQVCHLIVNPMIELTWRMVNHLNYKNIWIWTLSNTGNCKLYLNNLSFAVFVLLMQEISGPILLLNIIY